MNVAQIISIPFVILVMVLYFVIGFTLDLCCKLVALNICILVTVGVTILSPFCSFRQPYWFKQLSKLGGEWAWNGDNYYFLSKLGNFSNYLEKW